MRVILFGLLGGMALLAAVPVAPGAQAFASRGLPFRDHAGYSLDGIMLDEHAFRLVGLPFAPASHTMRDVTVVVFDAWDDEHGLLVQTIIEHAFPGARIVRYDYAVRIADCPQETMYMFLVCAQARFGDMFESIVREIDGYVVVNMSFKLFYTTGVNMRPVSERKGCEKAHGVVHDISLNRIASVVTQSPERFIWVAAAGNERSKQRLAFPACLSRVWAVSALERQEQEYDPSALAVAAYSNWAPSDMVVASPIGGRMYYIDGWAEGTSFAAPLFAGMAALWTGVCSTLPVSVEPRYFAVVPGALSSARAVVPTVLDVRC